MTTEYVKIRVNRLKQIMENKNEFTFNEWKCVFSINHRVGCQNHIYALVKIRGIEQIKNTIKDFRKLVDKKYKRGDKDISIVDVSNYVTYMELLFENVSWINNVRVQDK